MLRIISKSLYCSVLAICLLGCNDNETPSNSLEEKALSEFIYKYLETIQQNNSNAYIELLHPFVLNFYYNRSPTFLENWFDLLVDDYKGYLNPQIDENNLKFWTEEFSEDDYKILTRIKKVYGITPIKKVIIRYRVNPNRVVGFDLFVYQDSVYENYRIIHPPHKDLLEDN